MAYAKHDWQCGEHITASKLNHIEKGIEDIDTKGITKEVIKLGTFSVITSTQIGESWYAVSAGGAFDSNESNVPKTLTELIGDRTIVGFSCEGANASPRKIGGYGDLLVAHGTADSVSLERVPREDYDASSGGLLIGMFGDNPTSVDVYAICISI